MSEAELRAQIKQLESRLAALEPKPAPSPAPDRYREGEVRIAYHTDRGTFEMADEQQLKRLLQIVQGRYPALKLVGNVTERDLEAELCGFRASFWYLGHAHRRVDGLDSVGYPSHYADIARGWLRQFGGQYGEDTSIKMFLAAAVAHADIAIASQDAFTTPWGFGIGIIPVGTGGRPCSNRWRALLNGDIRVRELERTAVPTEKPTPVRIFNIGA